MMTPQNVFALDEHQVHDGFNVEPVVASESAIDEAISRINYGGKNRTRGRAQQNDDGPGRRRQELELAAEKPGSIRNSRKHGRRRSDPYLKPSSISSDDRETRRLRYSTFEPTNSEMRVRFRVDGQRQSLRR